MREVQSHEIDGCQFKIQQLGAKQGKTVLARLLRLVGPAAESDTPIDRLMAALTDAEVDFLCDVFSKTTRVCATNANGQATELPLEGIFDDHFAGRYDLMMKWLWACLNANFASFIRGLGLDPAKIRDQAMKAAMGPTAVSGASSSTSSAP